MTHIIFQLTIWAITSWTNSVDLLFIGQNISQVWILISFYSDPDCDFHRTIFFFFYVFHINLTCFKSEISSVEAFLNMICVWKQNSLNEREQMSAKLGGHNSHGFTFLGHVLYTVCPRSLDLFCKVTIQSRSRLLEHTVVKDT